VNGELEYFSGNLVGCVVKPDRHPTLNAVSVYSPAWPIDPVRLAGIDVLPVKLTQNPNVWVNDLLWAALKNADLSDDRPWVVGGDLNSSETFDATFGSGNAEFLRRMKELGLTECLRAHNRKLIPTFKNSIGGKVIHQIDHLFVTHKLYEGITNCVTGEQEIIFGSRSLSDHLPIIADFSS
jgi:endonuclease/exonuclease/phosphatase family metal-dependent hydrolase